MKSKSINPRKIVIFTGAGISAESGLKTFRDADGLWENHPVELVASPKGWEHDPELVLRFYNQRRQNAGDAEPNRAHLSIAQLEKDYDVVVITQNVDDLHERAGSTQVIHLHGELNKVRSTSDPKLIYNIGNQPILLGDKCEKGSQLRPHIVWFGEIPFYMDIARSHIQEAAFVLVVGTSLQVEPAASLTKKARFNAKKAIINLDIKNIPYGYKLFRGKATELVPLQLREWGLLKYD